MGNFGRRRLKKETRKSFSEIWIFLGFISNSLVFILLGMKIGEINLFSYWQEIIISFILVSIIARPISVFTSFFISNLFRKKEKKITLPYQIITVVSGLRGALAAAAVLLVPSDFAYQELLISITAGVILLTFIINATTIKWFLKKLKINTFTPSELVQQVKMQILINEKTVKYIKELLGKKYISKEIYNKINNRKTDDHE
jgi:CPA1 family monovalent cation:H+ antiporter